MLFTCGDIDDREAEVLTRIEELRRQLRFYLHEPRRWVGPLRRLSLARNIRASNSIEGYEASLDDAIDIAAGEEPLDADEETAAALAGYRQAMTYVLGLAGDEHFVYDAGVLRALQFMMCGHDLDQRPGRWRGGTIFVRDGATGEVVYEGPDVEAVPGLVAELVAELGKPSPQHPIVRAAMAHLNLVAIHPFRDGNGRMSRCLQTLVLAREGTVDAVFSSIEEYLGTHTDGYYRVLREVGGPTWAPDGDARPWVRFCLSAHLRSGIRLRRRIAETEALWTILESEVATRRLPDRTIEALNMAARGGRVRNSAYRSLAQVNEQQAGRDLRACTAAGLLEAVGEARGRVYVGSPELRALRDQVRRQRDPAEMADPFEPG